MKNRTIDKEFFMSIALKESYKMLGSVYPNPSVGCVIEKNGKIISKGVTQLRGRPHAEQFTINKIKNKNEVYNSNFYITIEPCTHYGSTPPCISEIIKYKPEKVYIGIKDPDQRVYNNPIKILKDNDIKYEYGILKKNIIISNIGYLFNKILNRPYITAKIACSIDNKIATKIGKSKWITEKRSRLYVHKLRKLNDAILTGANTIILDNPTLDCRLLKIRKNLINPKKLILSNKNINNILLNKNLNIFKNDKPLFITTKKDIKTIYNDIIYTDNLDDKNINLQDALRKIAQKGINNILVEAGSYTLTQLIKQNLIDKLIIIRAPIIIGNDGKDAIENLNINELEESYKFTIKKYQKIGCDILEEYESKKLDSIYSHINKIL